MLTRPFSVRRRSKSYDITSRGLGLLALLGVGNLAIWAWACVAFRDMPLLLGAAALAYSLGLRHAFDADHIAAIDNVTRKLMQDGKRPVATGLFFSLGHSTVVVALSVAVALGFVALIGQPSTFKDIAGTFGTSVSALFLLAIAAANALLMLQVYRAFRMVRRGVRISEAELQRILGRRGLLVRPFGGLFRFIGKSWHMYPLGLLFGLGFDTATEIGLLGMSASQVAHGMSIWTVLIFPALFAAGMSLMDTADGVVMIGAYGWAFAKPSRKLVYNMAITSVSAVAGLGIGGIEVLGIIHDKFELGGRVWAAIKRINGDFALLGGALVVILVSSWLVSIAMHRTANAARVIRK